MVHNNIDNINLIYYVPKTQFRKPEQNRLSFSAVTGWKIFRGRIQEKKRKIERE